MPAAGEPTRVLIADHPGPARRALAAVLSNLHDVTVVGMEDGEALDRAARDLRPDVVIVDDRVLDRWREPAGVGMRLIVLGIDDAPAYAERAARLHAVAWLPKESAGERLADAVRTARRSLSRPTARRREDAAPARAEPEGGR